MDNKKWSKRFSTIFWWVLAFLPLFSALIAYIGYYFAHLNSITNIVDIQDYFSRTNIGFSEFLSNQFSGDYSYDLFIPSFLNHMFETLFDMILNVEHTENIYFSQWIYLFSWATWIFIIHVIFDIIVWLPCFLHELIDRFKK